MLRYIAVPSGQCLRSSSISSPKILLASSSSLVSMRSISPPALLARLSSHLAKSVSSWSSSRTASGQSQLSDHSWPFLFATLSTSCFCCSALCLCSSDSDNMALLSSLACCSKNISCSLFFKTASTSPTRYDSVPSWRSFSVRASKACSSSHFRGSAFPKRHCSRAWWALP